MRVPGRRHLTNRRGATLPLVALMMVALLSIVALVADLGMLFAARGDAQRAADAAALAGASAYLEATPEEEVAEERARDYAGRNTLHGREIASGEVDVWVDHPQSTVRVGIQRTIPLTFARIFGMNEREIGAMAVARVTSSGTAACVKPFALPDTIYQGDDFLYTEQMIWEQRSPSGMRQITTPDSPPGGGNWVYEMLVDTTCARTLSTGTASYRTPDNNRVGQVFNGFDQLVSYDPHLTWSPTGQYDGFDREHWAESPRVAVIALYDHTTVIGTGTGTLQITGFLRVFFHRRTNPPNVELYGVILPASGISDTCAGQGCGEATRVLQLIQ